MSKQRVAERLAARGASVQAPASAGVGTDAETGEREELADAIAVAWYALLCRHLTELRDAGIERDWREVRVQALRLQEDAGHLAAFTREVAP